MAERRKYLDKLSHVAREQIRGIGGDPDFLDFLLGWHHLLPVHPSVKPPDGWRYWDSSRQRQVKRELAKRYGVRWKEAWKKRQALAKSYQAPELKVGLFSLESQGIQPPGARFHWGLWMAICDAKTYFTQISGRPHWEIIAEIFFPGHTFDYAQAEWARRKSRLCNIDNEDRLRRALKLYAAYRQVIVEVLKSGRPIFVSPHREQIEALHIDVESMLQSIRGDQQVR